MVKPAIGIKQLLLQAENVLPELDHAAILPAKPAGHNPNACWRYDPTHGVVAGHFRLGVGYLTFRPAGV